MADLEPDRIADTGRMQLRQFGEHQLARYGDLVVCIHCGVKAGVDSYTVELSRYGCRFDGPHAEHIDGAEIGTRHEQFDGQAGDSGVNSSQNEGTT